MTQIWGTIAFLFLSLASFTGGLPSGFIAEVIPETRGISGLFVPNPRTGDPMLLIVEKNGRVRVHEDPDRGSKDWIIILDLKEKMCTNGERGLQNAVIHPNFEENHYVYLFYTIFKEGCLNDVTQSKDLHPYNVVARFKMDAETLMLDYDDREEIWRGGPLGKEMHNGGAMLFGNDGKLYLTHGEAGVQENAQDMRNVFGTLMRLNDDGSTPEDNPYTKANGYNAYHCSDSKGEVPQNSTNDSICSEIYSYGFRNPFRISIDPREKEKVKFTIQDVGGKTWEELSYGGTDYARMDYGWKPYEGPCKRHSSDDCPIVEDSNYVEPFHYYIHRSDQSGCVSGAAFVPEGLWPEEYNFLYGDFTYYEVYNMIEAPDGGCRTCSPPTSRFTNETFFKPTRFPGDSKNTGRVLDLFFGPYKDTQALYVITYGKNSYRIRYTGIHDDLPIPDFSANKEHVDVEETIQFDSSGSYDPEGEEMSFQWYFGDGAKSLDANPTHSYDKPGIYEVTMFVTDAVNQIQQKSMTIMVGDPPTASILSPAEGDEFYVGQVLRLKGKANYLNGTAFDDSQLQWEVRKHHDDHYHPYLDPTYGNNIKLSPAPEPEDFYASTNSYLEIILYATDDDGLTTTITRNVQPLLVDVGIHSNLAGSKIEVNGEKVTASSTIVSWKDQLLNLKAESESSYQFVSWSDGFEEESRSVVVNSSDPILTANFCALNGAICSDEVLCCSGYCQYKLDESPYHGDPVQETRNASKPIRICSEERWTRAPTSTPTTGAPTTGAPTSAPTSAPSLAESKETSAPGATGEEEDRKTAPPAESESIASEMAHVNLFWIVVSVAMTIVVHL